MKAINIDKTSIKAHQWQQAYFEQPFLPLQQYHAYGHAMQACGADVHQISFQDGQENIGIALVMETTFLGLVKIATLYRGPLWIKACSDIQKQQALSALAATYKKWQWQFLITELNLSDTPENQLFMRGLGMRRVLTGFSTAWLDLRPDIAELRRNLLGKWRNQLIKAEKAQGLTVNIGGHKTHHYTWLIEKEEQQQTAKGYKALPTELIGEYAKAAQTAQSAQTVKTTQTVQQKQPIVSVTVMQERQPIAGALFLVHGQSATYHIGWAGEQARKQNIQNLVMWQGICALKKQGVFYLDMGGINTAELAGITRFKLGTGCTPFTSVGGYL